MNSKNIINRTCNQILKEIGNKLNEIERNACLLSEKETWKFWVT